MVVKGRGRSRSLRDILVFNRRNRGKQRKFSVT